MYTHPFSCAPMCLELCRAQQQPWSLASQSIQERQMHKRQQKRMSSSSFGA